MNKVGKLDCSLKYAREFKSITSTLQGILKDVILNFTPSGMTIDTFNDSNTFKIDLVMPKSHFDHYVCIGERSLRINLKTVDLVLKAAKIDDSLRITSEDEDHVTLAYGAECNNQLS